MNPYKKMARKQDLRVSKATGLRIRPNSGAISGHKGDLGGPDLFVETKTGYSKPDRLVIKSQWIDKVRIQSFSMGKPLWALIISPDHKTDYVVTPYNQVLGFIFDSTASVSEEDWSGVNLLLDSEVSMTIRLSEIDKAIYTKSREGLIPVYLILFKTGTDLAIMDLADYNDLYHSRHSKQN